MRSAEKIVALVMLFFAIGFNLWLYRLEPTATIDPNDNAFQFALVDRTNTVWDFAVKKCSGSTLSLVTFPICHFSYLADHWVHNWAEGYNLPYYYSHIPQIAIVASWRLITLVFHGYSLFSYYHLLIYLLLSVFPISVFLALRVMQLPWLTAGLGALLASQVSTDGLYGLDPPSFLWRGYGLSSQLFSMIWLPLAIAWSLRWFQTNNEERRQDVFEELKIFLQSLRSSFGKNLHLASGVTSRDSGTNSRASSKISLSKPFMLAVIFLTTTTAGHLGIGMIAMLSLVPLALGAPVFALINGQTIRSVWEHLKPNIVKVALLGGSVVFLLSYWIIPLLLHDSYHNVSFWDPVWKFDSYGWKETIVRLFNGDLFDFGRLPVYTGLVITGIFATIVGAGKASQAQLRQSENQEPSTTNHELFPLALLFVFWLLMYFGRTTWGGLIDLIPGMKEFHLSRFIVAVHATGMILAPIGLTWLVSGVAGYASAFLKNSGIGLGVYALLCALALYPIYAQTARYNVLNNQLITQANTNRANVREDEKKLFTAIRNLPPGRIFAGRGGWWGKKFAVAETPYYMHLSTYGLPTTLWLPETWSMNSDIEQYFSEDQVKDYDLFNIRYVGAPPDQPTQKFWKLIDEAPTWKLYEVETTGYFTTGVRPAIVASTKLNFSNAVRLWIQSDAHKNRLFPQLTYAKGYPKNDGLPNFKMIDEVTYVTPDNTLHNVFQEPPVYLPAGTPSIEEFTKRTVEDYSKITLIGPEEVDTDMIFKTKVEVGKNCVECLVVLKQTYHPGWKAYVDGKPVTPITVFPFFLAIPVSEGEHTIQFAYQPSSLKIALLAITTMVIATGCFLAGKTPLHWSSNGS